MQVKFITKSGEAKVVLMNQIPRIGDTIPLDESNSGSLVS